MSRDADDFREIMRELKDYVYRNHKLPSISDLSDLTGISNSKCLKLCERLEGQKEIYTIAGGGRGKPRIVIPYNMMETIFSTQPKPNWVDEDEYCFEEIEQLSKRADKILEQIDKFHKFQILLYGTDVPLEKAVAYALKYLEFDDVVHHLDNKSYADVTFKNKDIKHLLEVEGITKQGNKEKVLQLDGWLKVDIERGVSAKQLRGVLVVNHERDVAPNDRGNPLTPHAVQFMVRYDFVLITTPFLFELVKKVHNGEISKSDARDLILKGEPIEV